MLIMAFTVINSGQVLVVMSLVVIAKGEVNLEDYFRNCHTSSPDFDECVKDGINSLTAFFPTGLPEYGIEPFDPFYASEVPQKMNTPIFNYKLVLKNVSESGWTNSQITKFRTDFDKHSIHFTQFFPAKRLEGWYDFEGSILGNKITNQGSWSLALYDYIQTMTITKKPIKDARGFDIDYPPIKVKANIQSCKKLELHIGNLARGITLLENILDRIINTAWQPGFVLLSPIINDLVGTAFTEIFNRNFQQFPIEKLFQG